MHDVFLQVPYFLFIILTVYTMLPFQLWYAVVLSIISALSHITALTLRLTIYPEYHHDLVNQVKSVEINQYHCLLLIK